MANSMIKTRKFDDNKYMGKVFTRDMAGVPGTRHWISRSTHDTITITWRDDKGIKLVKRYDRDYVIRQFANGYWKEI